MSHGRWLGLILALIAISIAWPASQRLALDRSLVKMFAEDDPVRKDFEFLEQQFGVSDLIVFAYRDPELWARDGSGLDRLSQIRSEIESIDGIATAMELSKVDAMLGSLPSSFLPFSSATKSTRPLLDEANQLAVQLKKFFEGQTHSPSTDLVAIACLLEPKKALGTDPEHMSAILASLRKIGLQLPMKHGVTKALLVGQPIMTEEGFDAIEADGLRLGWFSSVSLVLLILGGFRSLRWAIISLAVVHWSLIVTRGLLVGFQWELTMVSSMLTSIVTVIGVATTMHWMLGYQQAMSEGLSAPMAMSRSLRQLWRPILWACVTDAIGFASLMAAKVGPVQDYGRMMALASLVVLAGIFLLVPGLALLPLGRCSSEGLATRFGFSYQLGTVPGDQKMRVFLSTVLQYTRRFAVWISTSAIAIAVVAVFGTLQLKVETDFIGNFKHDAPLVQAYRAVEKELSGAGVWDVVLPAPQVLTQRYLDWVLELESQLRKIEVRSDSAEEPLRLSIVMSFADADRVSKSSAILGALPIEGRLLGMRQAMGVFVDTLVTKDSKQNRYLRILMRSREQSDASQKEQLIQCVKAEVATALQRYPGEVSNGVQSMEQHSCVSGYYVLLAQLVSSVVADQWRCFAIATVGIWLAMSIALRSIRLSTLAILPNALPSMCILGWMGWTGMRVNLGAAMIAAVSMGLSVDSSLHYLMRYQSERRLGASNWEAISRAQSEIGMAMLLSTLALVVGFGSMSTSDFLPTVVFGVTAAISMLGGLITNLTILPALLVRNESSTRRV
jgi:uncharacterized protein